MSEIIFVDTKCAECEKDLPKFTVAEVVQPHFIVCLECYNHTEENWQSFQEDFLPDHYGKIKR